jgi:hypothetical protein
MGAVLEERGYLNRNFLESFLRRIFGGKKEFWDGVFPCSVLVEIKRFFCGTAGSVLKYHPRAVFSFVGMNHLLGPHRV